MTRARDVANIDGILTTKGDIYAATAAATPARLAVGNNGETLVADSSTSTGLRYTAGTVQANPILNSAFQIWQRGTSPTFVVNNSTNYQADRWLAYSPVAGRTVTRQVTGDTTNLPNIQYCARVQRTAGNTATDLIQFLQPMETINSIPFAGKTVTFSFYARRGANYSPTSNLLGVGLTTGTGTDENLIFPGYSGGVAAISQSATLTTTWQRFSYTATLNSNITEMTPVFTYNPIGTAGAADYFEITGVQLDVGSVALPFRTYAGTIQGELAACQRYYWRSTATQTGYTKFPFFALFDSSTNAQALCIPPVTMRTKPTSVDWSTLVTYDGSAVQSVTLIGITEGNGYSWGNNFTVSSGGVAKQSAQILSNNSASAFIGFSAEL
jgi:hypothetical protein